MQINIEIFLITKNSITDLKIWKYVRVYFIIFLHNNYKILKNLEFKSKFFKQFKIADFLNYSSNVHNSIRD